MNGESEARRAGRRGGIAGVVLRRVSEGGRMVRKGRIGKKVGVDWRE